MPRIADELLDCVFYLYPSKDAAERGQSAGGTGFFVGYTSAVAPNTFFLFAVSNKHVVADTGASVVRLNTKDGGVEIFEFEPHEWFFTAKDDLAIIPFRADLTRHRIKSVPMEMMVTPESMKAADVGPGDEVFMLGRFIKHDGKLTNTPSVRFGNLSMMTAPIDHPTLGSQESFAVEMRSMGGYSGSPVFIYPSPWNMNNGNVTLGGSRLFLLGVDWGHIVDHLEVKEKIVVTEQAAATQRPVSYVAANTGMNGVVPAWRLAQMIRKNPWTPAIEAEENRILASIAASTSGVTLDSAVPPANRENPTHREDFMHLVGAAAQQTKPKE